MKSETYTQYHNLFSNEVHQATGSYVIWKVLQNMPSDDPELLSAMNQTPNSWIFLRHSMMLSLIMTLGRIFDIDGDTISIDDLIKSCISDIHLFSKDSLRARKLKGSGNANEWIDDYMAKVYEPTQKDFQILRGDIAKFRSVYQDVFQPIRHNIFAHSNKEYAEKTDELWAATKKVNIEDLLNFLVDFDATIHEVFNNGKQPILKNRVIDENWFEKDISLLLNKFKIGCNA
ncbi:AbiU2 domain-containing protein [Cognaticolwellia mytili]|uniref:AbiU2 domain-containing protein n=1 Tax=Cognaticolwellia mytili TaxID=1888913 RepID=UPI000A178644|nr:hypothetical protein [Cognaticolwellia mytili]